MADELSALDREIVCVINLNSAGQPINCNICSIGAINQSIVSPREIFKTAILSNASSMIVVHNHISTSLKPSCEDIMVTDNLIQAGKLLGINLLDHIIVCRDKTRYYSFKQNNVMNIPMTKYEQKVDRLQFCDNMDNIVQKRR